MSEIPHGGLLVPYPEEIANAARPKPPSWVPVVILTILFGPLGAISAKRRATRARRIRTARYPYWVAFASAMAACLVAWAVAATVAAPLHLADTVGQWLASI